MALYSNPAIGDKTAVTWALASIGDPDAVVKLMRFLTNKVGKATISQREDDLRIETVEALGVLATRYEAPFLFLKKATDPEYWKDREFWVSPKGSEGSRLLALASIRALGLSARPEASLELLSLRRKLDDDRESSKTAARLYAATEQALRECEEFRRMGPTAALRKILHASNTATQTTSLR